MRLMDVGKRASPHAWALILLVVGCGGGEAIDAPDGAGQDGQPGGDAPPEDAAVTVVLSFEGEVMLHDPQGDDPSSNRTITVQQSASPATIPAFDESVLDTTQSRAAVIADIVAVVEDQFSPFDLRIQTTRPRTITGEYVLVVVGGVASDVGVQDDVVSLAILDCDNQRGIDAVGLVFTSTPALFQGLDYGSQVERLGVLIAQAVGAGFGLERVTDCPDTMANPFLCSSPQRFQDATITCGQGTPSECFCGGTTQNSFQTLLTVIGPA